MGDKSKARETAKTCRRSILPGSDGPHDEAVEVGREMAVHHSGPAGGGSRGMRIILE